MVTAARTNAPQGYFSIVLARLLNDTEESRQRFHAIVHAAIEGAAENGYRVRPRAGSTDPKGRWDMAVITPAD